MKITKIKRMNEKELLHHIIDNTEICDIKYANDGGGNVEIEEEIDEDTEFKRLVCINDNDRTVPFSNFTIRDIKDVGVKEFHAYIDGEFKLIWRDGKLVE